MDVSFEAVVVQHATTWLSRRPISSTAGGTNRFTLTIGHDWQV
jgi:hypothetical protein